MYTTCIRVRMVSCRACCLRVRVHTMPIYAVGIICEYVLSFRTYWKTRDTRNASDRVVIINYCKIGLSGCHLVITIVAFIKRQLYCLFSRMLYML